MYLGCEVVFAVADTQHTQQRPFTNEFLTSIPNNNEQT